MVGTLSPWHETFPEFRHASMKRLNEPTEDQKDRLKGLKVPTVSENGLTLPRACSEPI